MLLFFANMRNLGELRVGIQQQKAPDSIAGGFYNIIYCLVIC